MDIQFHSFVYKLVTLCFKKLNLSQQKNLSDLLVAFLHNRSFALWDIASGLSGETSTKHKHKRLIYFLDKLTIDLDFWRSYILAVFSLPGFQFKSRKLITLALDATTLREHFWLLAVSISFNGRGIPIYIKSWEDVNSSYDYWQRVRTVLCDLKMLLPKGYTFEIVADRGFQGDEMFKLCEELDIDFIVRINDSYKVKLSNQQEYIQLSLFNDGYYQTQTLGVSNPVNNLNLCVNSKENKDGSTSRWYLATNMESTQEGITESYVKRFWIEEGFKDLKSKLHWERYTAKIPTKGRLIKSIVVSSLSYAIQTAIGNQLNRSESEKKRTSLFNKFRQTIRRGTQELESIILKFINTITTYFKRAEYAFA